MSAYRGLQGEYISLRGGRPLSVSVDSTVSALTLFPGWEDIGPWYRAEVHGLTEAQLDFCDAAPRPQVAVVEHPAPHQSYGSGRVPLVVLSLGGYAVGRPYPACTRPPRRPECPARGPTCHQSAQSPHVLGYRRHPGAARRGHRPHPGGVGAPHSGASSASSLLP